MIVRCMFLCCSLLVVSALSAESSNQASMIQPQLNSQKRDACQQKSNNSVRITIGLHGSIQRTRTNADMESNHTYNRSNCNAWGGTVALGLRHFGGKNFIGAEVGVDFGPQDKRYRPANNAPNRPNNSSVYQKRDIVRQMLDESSKAFMMPTIVLDEAEVVDREAWRRYIDVLRYLGGRNDEMPQPFTTGEIVVPYIYQSGEDLNQRAVLANFMPNSIENIERIGKGDRLKGFEVIKAFFGQKYTSLAAAFNHLATSELHNGQYFCENTNYDGNADLQRSAADVVSYFLGNNTNMDVIMDPGSLYQRLGINEEDMGGVTAQAVLDDLNAIYFPPVNAQDELGTLDDGAAVPEISLNNLQRKTTFHSCPYVSMVAGRYFDKLDFSLYVKAGCMQLHGNLIAATDLWQRDTKFHKVTPFFAFGLEKGISESCSVAVEFAHALQTKKSATDRVADKVIQRNVKIKRDTIKVLFTIKW